MRHLVPTAPVMALIDRDGMSDEDLSLHLGYEASTVRHWRDRPTITFQAADRVLCFLNCEHLWHTDPELAAHYAPPAPGPKRPARRSPASSRANQLRLAEELDVVEEAA